MTRQDALQLLARDSRYRNLTAGEVLFQLTQAFKVALDSRDVAFFEFHGDEPCQEVARACAAGHVWHGNENGAMNRRLRKPHWQGLQQSVVPDVIRKN